MAIAVLYITNIVTALFTIALVVHGNFVAALLAILIGLTLIYFEMIYILIFKG